MAVRTQSCQSSFTSGQLLSLAMGSFLAAHRIVLVVTLTNAVTGTGADPNITAPRQVLLGIARSAAALVAQFAAFVAPKVSSFILFSSAMKRGSCRKPDQRPSSFMYTRRVSRTA